jgi:hypothetical protein
MMRRAAMWGWCLWANTALADAPEVAVEPQSTATEAHICTPRHPKGGPPTNADIEKQKICIERNKRPVTITVTDADGKPIPNAWVRVPGTDGRREVDPTNGKWSAEVLYLLDGTELWFLKNRPVEFMVSAPEYQTASVKFRVQGRKSNNNLLVSLVKMERADLGSEDDLLIQWFKRTNAASPAAEPAVDDASTAAPAPPGQTQAEP